MTDQPDRFFITTAIPYVNARPHIGHALEFVQTDFFARYWRSQERDVRFLSGADENSLKNVQAAEAAGLPTAVLVQQNSDMFQGIIESLGVSFDDFIRTSSDPRHAPGTARLWNAITAAGDVYKKSYTGLYCVGCEQFYTPDELTPDGLCPEHLTRPEQIEEENYFFRLSRYGDQLRELIESGAFRIVPESRRNEVLSFIRMGLEDFSISRSWERAKGWGIPVPGDPRQVMYVWVDALANYITALGYGDDGPLFQHYWNENPNRVHCVGKGIIRFHAIYWPALLLSAGVRPPSTLFVHGYLTVDGQKISKSLGNAIDPTALVEQYGAEAVRYYFLREVPAVSDSDFTVAKFETRYNSDLANDLGNLLNRTVSMIGRYRGSVIPAPGEVADPLDDELRAVAAAIPAGYDAALNDYDPQKALDAAWRLVTRANQYVEQTAPWTLSKAAKGGDATAQDRLDTVLYNLAESLRLLAIYLAPALPATAAAMLGQLGLPGESLAQTAATRAWGGTAPGTPVGTATPLFPRLG